MDFADYEASKVNRILVFGPPKSGKTAFVGQLARKYKLHWIDGEDGIKTLLNPAILPIEFRKNINVIRMPDTQTYPIFIETMLKIIKGGNQKLCWNHGKVACVACMKDAAAKWSEINLSTFTQNDILVIDSVTQLSISAMNNVIKGELLKDNWEYKATFHDYRAQGFLLDRIFSTMQNGSFNCVAISHETLVEMEDKKNKLVPTAGTSNFSKSFGKYFDTVVYLETVNGKHKAASSSTYSGSILTGSRTGIEIEKKEGATILDLFDPIYQATNPKPAQGAIKK